MPHWLRKDDDALGGRRKNFASAHADLPPGRRSEEARFRRHRKISERPALARSDSFSRILPRRQRRRNRCEPPNRLDRIGRQAHQAIPPISRRQEPMTDALKQHWPEYLMEGTCLGLFMISAFIFGTILEHPASPVHQTIPNPHLRRLLMGIAMGLTAITIISSPWSKQSGAHINPSTTFTFFRLGKVAKWDAIFYILSQFVGGLAGAVLAATLLSSWVAHPSVNYVITRPGMAGISAAFFAE